MAEWSDALFTAWLQSDYVILFCFDDTQVKTAPVRDFCFPNQNTRVACHPKAKPNQTVTWLTLVFPRLAPVECFPALGIGYMFSLAWRQLHVFPRLALAICLSALVIGDMFSCAWHPRHLLVFPPPLAPFTYYCFKFWLVHCANFCPDDFWSACFWLDDYNRKLFRL